MKRKYEILTAFAALVIAILAITYWQGQATGERVAGEVHLHADFKVYIYGTAINFSQDKYQSTKNKTLSPFVHVHDGDGNVLHVHARGVTLGEFFRSLKMDFNSTCFKLDTGENYCNTPLNTVSMYVNGVQNNQLGEYQPRDLDRILITYGPNGANVEGWLNSVTNNACIQSLKCPERGTPKDESSCVAGEDCAAIVG